MQVATQIGESWSPDLTIYFSDHYFNAEGQEIAYYSHFWDCWQYFNPPRVWSQAAKNDLINVRAI